MRTEVKDIFEKVLSREIVGAILSEHFEKSPHFRSYIMSTINQEDIVRILTMYWEMVSEVVGQYRYADSAQVKADLPLPFIRKLGLINVKRRSGNKYTDAPRHYAMGAKVCMNQGMLHRLPELWGDAPEHYINWQRLALLYIFGQGSITDAELKEVWQKSDAEIEEYARMWFDDEKVQGIRCRLIGWTNSGKLIRAKRNKYFVANV